MPSITLLYAGLVGLIAFSLAALCGRARVQTGISEGDGGNMELIIAMRRHANLIEFAPIVLILIGLLESTGASSTAIHVLGGGFVVARIAHAVGFTSAHPTHVLRTIGTLGSTLVLVGSSVWGIYRVLA